MSGNCYAYLCSSLNYPLNACCITKMTIRYFMHRTALLFMSVTIIAVLSTPLKGQALADVYCNTASFLINRTCRRTIALSIYIVSWKQGLRYLGWFRTFCNRSDLEHVCSIFDVNVRLQSYRTCKSLHALSIFS